LRKDARGVAASGSPSVLRLVLLGPPAATRDGRPVVFARRKSLGLLARLAVAPGLTIPRPTLTSLLWGGVGPEQATDSLRHSLTDIRHALGRDAASDVLQSGRDGVVLAPGAVEVDVSRTRPGGMPATSCGASSCASPRSTRGARRSGGGCARSRSGP
jgi:hypothetical protein